MYMPVLLLDRLSATFSSSLVFSPVRSRSLDTRSILLPCLHSPLASCRSTDLLRGSHEFGSCRDLRTLCASGTRKRSIIQCLGPVVALRERRGKRERGEAARGSRIGLPYSIKGEFTRFALDKSTSKAKEKCGQSKQRSHKNDHPRRNATKEALSIHTVSFTLRDHSKFLTNLRERRFPHTVGGS